MLREMRTRDTILKRFDRRNRSRKQDNRGSAIIMVIIVMAFVGVLASVVMWMSMANYMMKATDRIAKDNFYSSETVLEQILVGLQGDASVAMTDSFSAVVQQYAELSAENRQNLFYTLYLNALKTRLQGADDKHYDMERLAGYVDERFFDRGYVNKTDFLNSSVHEMKVYKDHLALEDITVEFYDPETGYTSIITTDYCLDVPKIDFTQSAAMPDIFEFSLVANHTLRMNPSITAQVRGNIYGGEYGIGVAQGAALRITDSKLVITDSAVSLNGIGTGSNGASLTIAQKGDHTQLWADSVVVSGGNAELWGKSYLADDLVIEERGGNVKLGGDYYGYGISESDADKSSAILINSRNSALDLSELDRILIGGRAYVGTGRIPTNGISVPSSVSANDHVPMGESISVKGSQIAYLVPSNCIGVLKVNDGSVRTLIGKNPMTGAEYTRMLAYQQQYAGGAEGIFEEVALDRSSSTIGTNLNYYDAGYKKVFVPSNGDTLVYYYLELSKEKAVQFFRDYYGMPYNKERLDHYFDFYVNRILTKPEAEDYMRIQIDGNWIVDEMLAGGEKSYRLNSPQVPSDNKMSESAPQYAAMFAGYTTKLLPDYDRMSEEEKSKSVFENLILRDKLVNYTGIGGNRRFDHADSDLNAVLSDRDVTYPGGLTDNHTRLIVTTKDVVVNGDFEGLIIAQGTITVADSVTIKPNRDDLARVLQYMDASDNTIKPIGFFVDGSNYVLNGTSVSINSTEYLGGSVEMSELVRYQNWEKK